MALHDMAKMTVSGTPGTGPITLGTAVPGFQTFTAAGAVNAETFSYGVGDTGNVWEVGVATYTAVPPSITRTPTASSSGGAAVDLTSAAVVSIVALTRDVSAGGATSSALLMIDQDDSPPPVDDVFVPVAVEGDETPYRISTQFLLIMAPQDGTNVDGRRIYIRGGDGGPGSAVGGSIFIDAGVGTGPELGGELLFRAGRGGPTGIGGPLTFEAGKGGITSGKGGDAIFGAGDAGDDAEGDGGDFTLRSGWGVGGGNGGFLLIEAGGAFGGVNGNGGEISVAAGEACGIGDGGSITFDAGNTGDGATGDGGSIAFTAGGVASTDGNGGNISFEPTAGTGTGAPGSLLFKSIPTSDPTVSEAVWNDHGFIVFSGFTAAINAQPDIDIPTLDGSELFLVEQAAANTKLTLNLLYTVLLNLGNFLSSNPLDAPAASNAQGLDVFFRGGDGDTDGGGGGVSFYGGQAAGTGVGGSVGFQAGATSGTTGGVGGEAFLVGGPATGGDADGGGATARGGGSTGSGFGGWALVAGGNAAGVGGTGGSVQLRAGTGTTPGQVLISDLPTSDPLVADALWLDNGAVVVSGATAAPSILAESGVAKKISDFSAIAFELQGDELLIGVQTGGGANVKISVSDLYFAIAAFSLAASPLDALPASDEDGTGFAFVGGAGDGSGSGSGGDFQGGSGGATGSGGTFQFIGGNAGPDGDGNGGDLVFEVGSGSGVGRDGQLIANNLTTTDPAVSLALWNEHGVLMFSGSTLAAAIAAADLSGLPTSNPGGGKVWLNGGVLQVGA